MALVACKECSKQVSDDAPTCPHCGVKKPGHKGVSLVTGLIVIVVGIFAVRATMQPSSNSAATTPPPTPAPVATLDPAISKKNADLLAQRFAENSKAEQDAKVAQAKACVQAARAKGEDVAKAANRCAAAASAPKPIPIDSKAQKEKAFLAVATIMRVLKANMREPESVVWESVTANDDASVICLQYRARNGFGGMARENVVFDKIGGSKEPSRWNRNCTKPLNDMLYAKHAL